MDSIERQMIIDVHRQQQPISELQRKADKAECRRSKLWTQEELDLAKAKAMEWVEYFADAEATPDHRPNKEQGT